MFEIIFVIPHVILLYYLFAWLREDIKQWGSKK